MEYSLADLDKILSFIFEAVVLTCLIQTFTTAAQKRGQIQNYSYPPQQLVNN